ncbi:microcystin-dependent protein [Breoghania corrubedonensis]|uniref:Microcystin-dependent protein n=1 Tax=Breoghania corrubedonensis TaxID=665038 RepID=A0A2T5V8K5_9HYPH|nr:tail fiber protein [Breoghania corrubedonensis]PTW60061.1 microcystin-dependent protein [Breoghania corrubedonensis]
MAEPFLAEIKIIGFNFAPRGWAFCDGQILPINQNQSLYSILGTTYGGDGRTTFALPDLRSRTPVHSGEDYRLGAKSGSETVTLTVAQIPEHSHSVFASSTIADQRSVDGTVLAQSPMLYADPQVGNMTQLRSGTVVNTGGNQAHNNMQPYLTLGFCIALQGLFPSRN